MKIDKVTKSMIQNDIIINVYYKNEKDMVDGYPFEVVVNFPDYMEKEAVYLSDFLPNCTNVIDITQDHHVNEGAMYPDGITRVASIECFGAVNHIVGEPKRDNSGND